MFQIFQGSYRTSQFISTRSTCKLMHGMSVKSQYYDGDIFFPSYNRRGFSSMRGRGMLEVTGETWSSAARMAQPGRKKDLKAIKAVSF